MEMTLFPVLGLGTSIRARLLGLLARSWYARSGMQCGTY